MICEDKPKKRGDGETVFLQVVCVWKGADKQMPNALIAGTIMGRHATTVLFNRSTCPLVFERYEISIGCSASRWIHHVLKIYFNISSHC